MKYVIIDTGHSGNAMPCAIVFAEDLVHARIVESYHKSEIISAGFCHQVCGRIVVDMEKDSESLKKGPIMDHDSEVLNAQIMDNKTVMETWHMLNENKGE